MSHGEIVLTMLNSALLSQNREYRWQSSSIHDGWVLTHKFTATTSESGLIQKDLSASPQLPQMFSLLLLRAKNDPLFFEQKLDQYDVCL